MANNKRTYEAILVLDTQGSEDSADALTSKVSEIIAGMGGEVKKVENLGFRTSSETPAGVFAIANTT